MIEIWAGGYFVWTRGESICGKNPQLTQWHVWGIEFSMQHHIHMHKKLHRPMYTVWRKKNPPQETGAEKTPKHKTEPNPQTVMCSIKKVHTPKIKKYNLKKEDEKEDPTATTKIEV